MGAQWPQQFQNQKYNGYHQQYSQHPQYSPTQNGPYHHQQFQQNVPAGPPQQHARPSLNSCYNCGALEHWAQDCPEPRREHPVGLLQRQNHSRPPKRHKPNAPIITKYPVPPNFQQPLGPSQGYGGGQYNQAGYPPHPGPYGPPTPMSTQSPSQPQWQQTPQYQHYQQPYQQGNPYQQGGPYQHSYPTPTAQTPTSYYGNNNSNQSSPQGPPQGPHSYSQHSQYHQPQGFQGSAYSAPSPASTISPSNGYPVNQFPERNYRNNSVSTQRGTHGSHQAPQTYAVTTKPHVADSATTKIAEGEDQLGLLNIPDLPLPNQVVPSGSAPTHLVGRPLPANFVVADAISPIGPPLKNDEGRCQSKYWGRETSISIFKNIKDTSYWDDVEKDPIFSSIPDDNIVIPLDDVLSIYRPRQAEGNVQEPEPEQEEAQPEPSPEPESKNANTGRDTPDIMDSLENALNAGRHKQADVAKETNNASEENSEAPRDTEQVLAALGVTGAPKPVRAPARPYPPPSHEQGTQGPSGHISRSRSRSPARHETNGSYHRDSMSNSGGGSDNQSHDANDPSNHDTYSYKQKSLQEHLPLGRNSRGSADLPHSQPFEPPPPPPPMRKQSLSEGANNSPISGRSNHGDGHMYAEQHLENGNGNGNGNMNGHMNGNGNGNGHGRYPSDGHTHTQSPVKARSEKSVGRKREYDNRDSSDEDDTPRRRQADDVTPKLKRRQPKVDAAYSRRW